MRGVAHHALLLLVSLVLLGSALAARATPGLLLVSGIGGEEVYARQFRLWALEMLDAARERLGLPAERVVWLCEAPERDPDRCAGESRREAVLLALERLARDGGAESPLMLLLIGHGTARDGRALFNVSGPDLSAEDLAAALDALAGDSQQHRPIAVVNTSSASAPFTRVLAGPGRIVVTATASEAEDDYTRFAGHFVTAYGGSAADADKDGRVSLLEAFRFATGEVARQYRLEQQLVTEHALLEDDGDGRGSREPSPDTGDGVLAAQFHLALARGEQSESPVALALERDARDLVAQIAALRRQRVALAPERYERALEELLLVLARNRRALRAVSP